MKNILGQLLFLLTVMLSPLYGVTDIFDVSSVDKASIEQQFDLMMKLQRDRCTRMESIHDQASADKEAPRLALQVFQMAVLTANMSRQIAGNAVLQQRFMAKQQQMASEISSLGMRDAQASNKFLSASLYGSRGLYLLQRIAFLLESGVSLQDLMTCTVQMCILSIDQTLNVLRNTSDKSVVENYLREYGVVAFVLESMLEEMHRQQPGVEIDSKLAEQFESKVEALGQLLNQFD